MLTKEELAARLQGRAYRRVMSPQDQQDAKAAGLVVLFGYSDDGVDIRGAVDDQLGAGDGTKVYFTPAGLLRNDCAEDGCPYYAALKQLSATVTARWGSGEYAWSYLTDIPHATFEVLDDGAKFCLGIVFALADVRPARVASAN